MKKGNAKSKVLAKAVPYMGLVKKKLLMNSFFAEQFNYYPLVWMIHSPFNNNKGKYLHKTCFRLMYSDKTSGYR